MFTFKRKLSHSEQCTHHILTHFMKSLSRKLWRGQFLGNHFMNTAMRLTLLLSNERRWKDGNSLEKNESLSVNAYEFRRNNCDYFSYEFMSSVKRLICADNSTTLVLTRTIKNLEQLNYWWFFLKKACEWLCKLIPHIQKSSHDMSRHENFPLQMCRVFEGSRNNLDCVVNNGQLFFVWNWMNHL